MRAPSSEMKTGLKKGPWSLEEDEMLKSYINRYGIWNWSQMPKFAGLARSGKSCRLRWMNYLKPNIKRGNFSQEDEEIILHFHSILGNRWSAIASKLPGRRDNEIKNYWHTHLKKRGTRNLVREITTDQNEVNASSTFEADNVEKRQEPDNHAHDLFESFLSLTSEDDSSSSSSSTATSEHHTIDFKTDCYDIGSPGTVEDLLCFWKQLCPSENFEVGGFLQDVFSDPVFEDSYSDAISSYSFYDKDYDTTFNLNDILPRL